VWKLIVIAATEANPDERRYRIYVLAVLVLVYTFNFLDRQITGILAIPIKAELGLTDTQLGAMGGLAFALFYTSLGIPIARLADRGSRTLIITVALALWSAMTAACGLAQNFAQLFLARLGVGVGEAGGVAPAYSLLCDYFPPGHRGRAFSAYAFGVPIGSAIAMFAGGYLSTQLGWRAAFATVGLAGLVVAPLLRFTVREPPRGRFDEPRAPATPPTLGAALRVLARKPAFWCLALGGATASMAGYGVLFWMPSFLVRSFGLDLLHASRVVGVVVLVGGLVGIWCGGALADRAGVRHRRAYALVPAVAFLVTVPLYVAGVLAGSLVACAAVLLVPTALSLAWLGPVTSAVQQIVPVRMRATASAVFLFVINLIGIGAGTTVMGFLSEVLRARFGIESLRYAILAASAFYLLAALFFWLASRRLERDWDS
jgi:predicted MFS family arabinose efflux permease